MREEGEPGSGATQCFGVCIIKIMPNRYVSGIKRSTTSPGLALNRVLGMVYVILRHREI